MIQIFLADDHPIVREGIKAILLRQERFRITGEFEKGSDLLKNVHRKRCDLLILDLSLPDKNGIEILKELSPPSCGFPVLVLSVHPEEQYAPRVLKAGASGYLTKECIPDRLIEAVNKILSGGFYFSDAIRERFPFILRDKTYKEPHEYLSEREYEVFLLIAKGKKTMEIAKELRLNNKTVSCHRTHVMEKLSLSTNSELTRYAIRQGLIEP